MITKKDVLKVLKNLQRFVEKHEDFSQDNEIVYSSRNTFNKDDGISILTSEIIIKEEFISKEELFDVKD